MGDCHRADKNYRGTHYDFCVAEDLNIKNIPHAKSVGYFKAYTDVWLTFQWNVYGINAIKLSADVSDSVKNCPTKGKGEGKSWNVNGNDNKEFNLKDFKPGLYKFELFVTQKDNQIRRHNEIYVCIF